MLLSDNDHQVLIVSWALGVKFVLHDYLVYTCSLMF